MMDTTAAVLFGEAVVFFAALVHGVAGFGAALVAMPLLGLALNVKFVSPLVALLTLSVNLLLLWRGRREASPAGVAPLAAGAAAGVPLGVLFLARFPEGIVQAALGSFLVLYSLYALLGPSPPLMGRRAGLVMGLLSGAIGGAFNTGGPPAVVYASAQKWSKAQIHASLQLYFSLVGILVVSAHALAGLTTAEVLKWFVLTLPALAAGGAAGFALHRRTAPAVYRRIVYGLLLVLGAVMIWR